MDLQNIEWYSRKDGNRFKRVFGITSGGLLGCSRTFSGPSTSVTLSRDIVEIIFLLLLAKLFLEDNCRLQDETLAVKKHKN